LRGHRRPLAPDEPREVFAFVAEIEDVVEILDVDVLAELRLNAFADPFPRQTEAVVRRRGTRQQDPDWFRGRAPRRFLLCQRCSWRAECSGDGACANHRGRLEESSSRHETDCKLSGCHCALESIWAGPRS